MAVRGILLAVAAGPLLWLVGAVVFDGVHWVLHRMLRSRSRVLRALARPHGVHHEWIDRDLVTHWERQTANVWCHIVPEYLTQLVFTAGVALVLPLPFALVLGGLQTAVFLYILSCRGRDLNHRPEPRIDAPPPGWGTPPSYHALHHAFPDAHFSAYTKLVDRVVGGGAQIAGRRFAWIGAPSPLAGALRAEVSRWGGCVVVDSEQDLAAALAGIDVLVLVDPRAALAPRVEAFVAATRERRLPPEVWALRCEADPIARHYLTDPRVLVRVLSVGDDPVDPARAARRALFRIRRDARFVALGRGGPARRRFLRTRPVPPPGAQRVRLRMELLPG